MDVLCRHSILSTFYTVFTLLSISQGQDLVPPAAVTTVHAGNSAVLTCTLPSSAPSTATVTWSVVIPQTSGQNTIKKIVIAPDNFLYNPSSKYSINGTYNLAISNTDAQTDGTTYQCDPSTDPDVHPGEVIVIDKLEATVSPDGSVIVDNNMTFTCMLYFGAQQKLNSLPTVSLFLGRTEIQGQTSHNQPSGASLYHSVSLVVSHVVTEADKGQSWSCRASSPPFTMSSEPQLMKIDYAPKTIIFSPDKALYDVGEHVNCTADGYPPPNVQCKLDDATQVEASGTGSAVLTVKLSDGTQHWTCEARNRLGGLNKTHSFTVNGGKPGNSSDTDSGGSRDNNKAVGIGVGIGIGLGVPIVIAVIILVCVLMRRKGRSKEEQITKSPAPPSTETGKPINEAGRPQRPPSNTYNGPGISTNPNPGYKPPVYPEQMSAAPPKTTPDRPGYGDLGVGHIHAGGSTPSLNRSYESSHSRAVGDDDFNHQGPHTSV